ncbi:hypothetical protein JCM10212_007110 [Sporobolomyces blumeae]
MSSPPASPSVSSISTSSPFDSPAIAPSASSPPSSACPSAPCSSHDDQLKNPFIHLALSEPSRPVSSSPRLDSTPSPSTMQSPASPSRSPGEAGMTTVEQGLSRLDLERPASASTSSEPTSNLAPTIVAEAEGPLDVATSPTPTPDAAASSPAASAQADASAAVPSTSSPSPIAAGSTSPPPLLPRQSAPPAAAAPGRPVPSPGAPTASGVPAPQRRPPAAGGALKAGVRGSATGSGGPLKMPPSLAAKMAAMTSRSSSGGTPPIPSLKPSAASGAAPALAPRPPVRPPGTVGASAPPRTAGGAVAGPGGLAAPPRPAGGMAARRRGPGAGLTLSGLMSDSPTGGASGSGAGAGGGGGAPAPRKRPGMKLNLSEMEGGQNGRAAGSGSPSDRGASPNGSPADHMGTPFSNFRKIVDPSGRLNFAQKAILHADGVDFSSGASFKIKMDDFELFEELGKGNYGTVQKVLHRPTGVTMALKEIRLELDDSKLKTIITELDILHRATSPYIIDFYGAFFIESCVYYCMEFMDAGSLEVVAGLDVPEDVLARITRSMVEGLKFLKDDLKIMHRDVKPTNVLLNRNGSVKLCDFGVSGQLDRSLAKTNIGCQSYMAPERIKGESQGAATSYTASSDVWSLGLSIIEAAIGHYPYPPETYQNVFAQLTAIVHGDPPSLPERYSETARDFVARCLEKQADRRPTYAQLLDHPWLKDDKDKDVDMVGWISKALAYREKNPKISAPALA